MGSRGRHRKGPVKTILKLNSDDMKKGRAKFVAAERRHEPRRKEKTQRNPWVLENKILVFAFMTGIGLFGACYFI